MDRLTYLFKQYDNILGWYQKAESKGTLLEIKGARLDIFITPDAT